MCGRSYKGFIKHGADANAPVQLPMLGRNRMRACTTCQGRQLEITVADYNSLTKANKVALCLHISAKFLNYAKSLGSCYTNVCISLIPSGIKLVMVVQEIAIKSGLFIVLVFKKVLRTHRNLSISNSFVC